MANLVKQFRFYSDADTAKNYPADATGDSYRSGNIFKPYFPIVKLGIQSLPGTMFYLNDAKEPVIIGHTGIYELDLGNNIEISSLRFEDYSIDAIETNPNAHLIVDIIYDNREES